jgi:hypothetical protein
VCAMVGERCCFVTDLGLLDELQAVVIRNVCDMLFSVTLFVWSLVQQCIL